ncbi:probable LRR receptor-like serine/threonine-protein kinase At1g56140 [Andrographis paniculata]|uniref:probable LRR receptor-like serine/threonine-protein kinase At1g56140 n=1 Tax=Andrographis paniculata TaxID=175694 RepID=UPI0021E97B18|nr:probable LRR receptor-like serine/threonine-protein kinase At1g56140 [Andrographis paniculata]
MTISTTFMSISCRRCCSVLLSIILQIGASFPFYRKQFHLFAFGFAIDVARAQNRTVNATIDPAEERALNAMFARWGIQALDTWNISGELCSGVAIDSLTPIDIINPGIKCSCNFNSSTICHITALRVYALDVSGPLPDELWNLTFLENLNLGQNYLTGPFPASIGRLTRMQYLTIGINALSGEVPRELGMLNGLLSLAFGTNNFTGPLPSELGNLSRLTQIYFDSAGVSGPIPDTFAGLQRLEKVWASDNELSGQIPEFIGNWTSLVQLRLEGNSFQGPIPQSFSNLTSLTDLRISGLSNGSSTSLDFLRNMASLSTLVLQNNNISGTIPQYFGTFQNMTLLDLSFNNLTGTLPDPLFNLSSLTHLFLGTNKLNGSLPSQKSPSLRTIDLSYNELSGSFPSWLSQPNLQINLVSNNFTIDNSNGSSLPSGLNCLQRNFPCNRGSPIYSSFAVKCGGPQITSSDQVVYEWDNETLGPATHYMTGTGRWAVSNVGLLGDNNNPRYTTFTSSQFTNTLDSELFQTARTSPGSLRYYGLGLENGNYTVTLQFAESVIVGTRTWRSVGRRVFDIYVQGLLVAKDFDITREAGGSLRGVVRQYRAQVLQNHIDVHLFWAGKGTCCVPAQGTYGPLISAISAAPADFTPTVSNNPPGGNSNRTGLIVGIVVGVAAAAFLCVIALFFVLRRRKKQKDFEDEELLGIDARPYTFSYAELRAATDDFDPGNKLGEGGFGPVYKGKLGDGRAIAVKQLSVASHQGKSQFVAEIATISAVQHRNLVKLYGCCIEGDQRLLVYEFLENKSLDKLLFETGSRPLFLDWGKRYDICLGVARGLAYLHEESRLRIVHRDVKASNILLDSELTPKISDFGLAKLYDDKKTHISTRVAGTIGYLAPEYAMRGHLTEKADTFSFGVVALEIISGRPNSNSSLQDDMMYLLEWAWHLQENNRVLDLVDPSLHEYNSDEATRIIGVALLCTQASPALRPAMSRVVAMLSGDIEVASVTTRPGYLTDWKFNDTTTFMSSNADSSTSNAEISYIESNTNPTQHPPTDLDPTKPILHQIIGEGR